MIVGRARSGRTSLFEKPTQGLDPVVSAVIDKLIVDLTERQRITSVISSSAIGFPALA